MKVSGDSADAPVHGRGGCYGGHRIAQGHRQDLALAHPHAKHDSLCLGLFGLCLDDGSHASRIRIGRDGPTDCVLLCQAAQ
jgi:hypothetical protein